MSNIPVRFLPVPVALDGYNGIGMHSTVCRMNTGDIWDHPQRYQAMLQVTILQYSITVTVF